MSEQKFGIIVDKEDWTIGEVRGANIRKNSIYSTLAVVDAFERYGFYEMSGEKRLMMVFKGSPTDLPSVWWDVLIGIYIPEREIGKAFNISELQHVYIIPKEIREEYDAFAKLKYKQFITAVEHIRNRTGK